MRLAFVTSSAWPDLTADDKLVSQELVRRGHEVAAVVWDDRGADWTQYQAIILRSCWDYHESPARFLDWVGQLEREQCPVLNPAVTVRWNLDKHYLAELDANGVVIAPSAFPGPGVRLEDLIAEQGWADVVIKPRISADGHRTHRVRAGQAREKQGLLDELSAAGGALVQAFLPEIEREGEFSFVFLGGGYSHAALKRPAAGEFRVQPRLGGRVRPVNPPAPLIEQAEAVMSRVTHPWLYARVDGCIMDGRLVVMEVELIEPTLFFDFAPPAVRRFADLIEGALATRSALPASDWPGCWPARVSDREAEPPAGAGW